VPVRTRGLVLSFLILFSAFAFAFITNEGVHEAGHWLAHRAYGSSVGVVLDPFGASRIVGAGNSSAPLGVTSVAGPTLSVLLSGGLFSVLWRWRRSVPAAFLFMFPVALIQEGVTFSLGLLTPGGDASHVAAWGIPVPVLALLGIGLLVAGVALLGLLLPLVGLSSDDRARRNLLLIGGGMIGLMLLRFAVSVGLRSGDLVEATVPLLFSFFLATGTAVAFGPIQRRLGPRLRIGRRRPTAFRASVSLALAVGVIALQFSILN
jgi:hypothetical protein